MSMRGQRGVALAVLLWFIAAMTILVGGLTLLAKTDIRYARYYNARATATAVGDGAIRLLLAQQVDAGVSTVTGKVVLDKYTVYVRAVPGSGLIDVLSADEDILTALFTVGAGLGGSAARTLAQSVIEWRVGPAVEDEGVMPRKPDVLEDIMAVAGLSRDDFERIKWLICLGCGGPAFGALDNVPVEVRPVLQAVSADMDPPSAEPARVSQDQVKVATAGVVRVDARVDMGAAGIYQRSVWVAPGGQSRLGWRFIRPHASVAMPSVNFNEF